jgi:uncharacterized repeat protein (TIGR01451 family)
MGLNNSGDTISLWADFASYSGDNTVHANAVETVAYDDDGTIWPLDDGFSSIYLVDLAADNSVGANWALSAVGVSTPVYTGYTSNSKNGNSGADVGSPGPGLFDPAAILISEIMYNPNSFEDDWEWVEVYNSGTVDANLAGWVIDDINSVGHTVANIAAGVVPAGGSAVLFNVDDTPAVEFETAWGMGINLIPVTNWTAMGLNNGGDTVSLWSDFASYSGDNTVHANAVDTVAYDDDGTIWPADDGFASIFLTSLAADNNVGANWALSQDGLDTPLFTGYTSLTATNNFGTDVGSPGPAEYPAAELVITEIMYNPNSAEDNWEWIEVVNVGALDADLAGWVVDDINASAHLAANIAAGTVPAGESAILFNVDDISAGDFEAAWGTGINLIPVTNWGAMGLNNGGDTVSLWTDFASYSGDNLVHANAVETVPYDDDGVVWPSDDGFASIYLVDLGADNTAGANWALSTDGGSTPVFTGFTAAAAGGNAGTDIGSPGPGFATELLINEMDADQAGTDAGEFIELYDGGSGNTSLDGLVLVLFNGSDDASYLSFDLDGHATDESGYFVLCGDNANVPNCDLDVTPDTNLIQNGADAVALFVGNASEFPNDTPVTATGLIDAIVYDTDDSDDPGLLDVLTPGQPQVNERAGGDGTGHSSQRCPNGSGGPLVTTTFLQFSPTPGAENVCLETDLELEKSVNLPLAFEGDTLTYTLSVMNTGAEDAPAVVVKDYLPDTTTLVENVTNDCGATLDVNTLTWNVGTLAAGNSATCLVSVDIRAGTDGQTLVNSAEIFSAGILDSDSTPGNFVSVPAEDDEDAAQTSVGIPLACGTSATFIHTIQGDGLLSPEDSFVHTIEGVVVGTYQDTSVGLSGFFVQEEDSDADANPATSEGIFVFDNGFGVDVLPGYVVRVTGTVDEFFDLTELTSVTSVVICGLDEPLPAAGVVTLPVDSIDDWEPFEGMRVTIPQTLYATEHFQLGRFGQVALSAFDRLYQPTHLADPGADAAAVQDLNDRTRIMLDDGSNVQNPDPVIHPDPKLTFANTLRGGDSLPSLTGVLAYSFGEYRVHPVGPLPFTPANPRTASPAPVGGALKVASFNVLNYFTTIDDGSSICGPDANLGCRGADSAEEFTRQRDKIINAILGMDADIVGLIEIENHATDAALIDLVDGLNAAAGSAIYSYIPTGPVGDDAIKVALIYKSASVTPSGAFAVLDTSVDPTFLDSKNRPVLAQTFEEVASGEKLTVAVNHLKSKGSPCTDVGDPNLGDGQGNCNLTRTTAAIALANWLASDPTSSGDPDFMIIGDLNSYAMEDPITALKDAGYTDLLNAYEGSSAYSYVFDGQWGYLDYALSTSTMLQQITGVTAWHINSDEPLSLDYNTDFKSANQIIEWYDPAPYRASDHDPVIVGLNLGSVAADFNNVELTNPVREGTMVYLSGDILDTDINQAYTMTVDWGDGTVEVFNYPAGTTGFVQPHVYVDDNPTGSLNDPYTLMLTLEDVNGVNLMWIDTRVHNLAPDIKSLEVTPFDDFGFSLLTLNFTDKGIEDTFTLQLNWGDGTIQFYHLPAGTTEFTRTHTYVGVGESDSFLVSIILTDDDNGVDTAAVTVTSNDLDFVYLPVIQN